MGNEDNVFGLNNSFKFGLPDYTQPSIAPSNSIGSMAGWGVDTGGLKYGGSVLSGSGGTGSGLSGITGSDWFKSMMGGKDADGNQTNGWGGMALGGLSAVNGFFSGRQQMAMQKDMLKENKRQYDQNFDAQRKTLNTQMEDRQAARVASNPTAYQSVGDYMNNNRI